VNIDNFYIAGINYKKSNVEVRGLFSINQEQYLAILNAAGLLSLKEVFVLSTCNRTEIYGVGDNVDKLINLLCNQTKGSKDLFYKTGYIKKGKEAIEHLFKVASGLDSQILGDYEIVGQLKMAVKLAKENGFIGSFFERLFNQTLQLSKTIKNETKLSSGTVSVAFAAINYIKEKVSEIENKRVLIIGTGKIGRTTCKNIIDYLNPKTITLFNRTEEKAEQLAKLHAISYAKNDSLEYEINNADIILVATNSPAPIILKNHLINKDKKLIIDLSVPSNVEENVRELNNVDLINVDELSKIKDETLLKREAEIPKALSIINTHTAEFTAWNNLRKNVPALKAIKQKLENIHHCKMFISYQTNYSSTPTIDRKEKIQKTVTEMAVRLKDKNQPGCHYIQALHDYIAL